MTLARTGAYDLNAAAIESPTRSFVAGVRPLLMACLALAILARTDPRLDRTPAALHFAFYALGVGLIGTRSLLGSPWVTPAAGVLTALSYAAVIRTAQRFPRALSPADFGAGGAPFFQPISALLAWLLSPWLVWPIGFLLGGLYLFVALPGWVGYLRLSLVAILACAYLWRSVQLADGEQRKRLRWILLGGAIYLAMAAAGLVVKAASAGDSPAAWWWVVMAARYASLGCFAVALLAKAETPSPS